MARKRNKYGCVSPVAQGKKEVVNGWGWTDEHLSWNWEGLENQPMRVNVYSRSPKVRLYLNDILIGEKIQAVKIILPLLRCHTKRDT